MEKETEGEEKPAAPITSMFTASSYSRRAKYMKELKDQGMETTTFEEVLSRNKVTTMNSFKKKPKDVEDKDDPDFKLDEVNDYINDEDKALAEIVGEDEALAEIVGEDEGVIDLKKIRELEGEDEKDILEEEDKEVESEEEEEEKEDSLPIEDDSDENQSEAKEV